MWKPGRLNTGYLIFKIFCLWFVDLYLIKIPSGAYVPRHLDPVPGKRHYRINLHFGRFSGGKFLCDTTLFSWRGFHIFRSDEAKHKVSKVKKGTLFILSLGIAI